jgi:GMP synthase (glutamine-hydrolysing)
MKSALIIRHVPHEGVAGYRLPIEEAGYEITRIDVGDPAFSQVDLVAPDLVIMMGGPMGVYEQERFPWIACQLRRLARRLEADRPTLGVCFGSQMIAAALGARVYAGPVKEVGFSTVALTDRGQGSPLRHLAGVPVLHWHGDTFDLPERAERLAETAAYPNQAFRRGPRLLALQFHAEMGEDPRIDAWLEDEAYIASAGMNPATIRQEHDRLGPGAVAAGRLMIRDWLAGLGT